MPKKKQNSELNKDIKGIILITLGILIIISIFSSSSGVLGNFFRKLVFLLFGLGAYIFPILVVWVGLRFITNRGKISFNKKFYAILIIFINTLMIIQRLNSDKYFVNNEVLTGIHNIYNSSSVIHGGILCYLLDIMMFKLLGNVGCYVVYFSVYIVSFVLIFELSLGNMFKEFKHKLEENKNNDEMIEKEIVEDKIVQDSKELEAYDAEKEQNVRSINDRIKIIDFIKSGNNQKNDFETGTVNEEIEKQISERNTLINVEYKFPKIDFLKQNTLSKLNREDKKELISNANKLEETLSSFGVEAKVLQVTKGPSVTRFELQPNAGVKVSKIVNLADDIALNLAASGVRIEAPIPGKSAVGIEVPNRELTAVYLREVLESEEFINSNKNLAFALGKDIGGKCVTADLSKMPHVLIAGATGSGKSVCINTLIISILYKYSPQDVKLLMIDPKVVELSVYNGIPHLLVPVVTDPKKAAGALNWAVNEMSRRYKIFAENNVRNIESYNELFSKEKIDNKLHWIVIIIDELADLMMVCPNDIEDYIGRLAQMARAAGMHLVIATQRPSVDVITGVIKANIPSRISFAVSSQIDSRTILDTAGAEKLLGKGDMLFYPVGESKPLRIQGAFISEEEVEKVVEFIKQDKGEPEYHEGILAEINTKASEKVSEEADELLEEAIRIVIEAGQASTSLIQRRLRIGYNRAARIIEQMEERGIISPKDGSRPREIIISKDSNEYRKYYQGNNMSK